QACRIQGSQDQVIWLFLSGMNKTPQAIAGFCFGGLHGHRRPTPRNLPRNGAPLLRPQVSAYTRRRVAGPERHVEEATLSASGPTALRKLRSCGGPEMGRREPEDIGISPKSVCKDPNPNPAKGQANLAAS